MTTLLRLTLLGGFQARRPSGEPIALPSKKARALISYLALHPGQAQERDKLATLLWGDAPADRARHSLRQVLVTLRHAVPGSTPQLLVEEAESVAVGLHATEVDVDAFRRLASMGTLAALEQAATLYQGDFLEGLDVGESPFEDWLLSEREVLRETAVELFAKLLAHHSSAENLDAAIQAGVRLLALDPAQEPVHRTLMRVYVQQGRRSAALRQYQLCVNALHRELGVEPEAETKQLYQDILRRGAGSAAATADVSRDVRKLGPSAHAPAVDLPAPDTPLIGREAEAATLREALDAACAGRGRVALLLGEAGIGKTRLVAEVAALAVARDARILIGRCYESAQILPFGPWVEALRTGQVLDQSKVIDGLGDVWRRELGRLFPEVMTARATGGGAGDYLRLFEAMARLLRGVAASRALVLALEDLHWADDMSLRFLAFLGRHVATSRILVVATAREEQLVDTPALGRTLVELRAADATVVLTMDRLSREATAGLVAALSRTGRDAATTGALADRIWRASEGNPFIAVETFRALEAGTVPIGEMLPLPARVRELIIERLARLGSCARELAAVAAVIGREFEFAVLHRAAGVTEREAADGVEELVRRRILQGVGERFDFTHDRIRDVAYGQLLGPRRKLLHAAVGQALEDVYAVNLGPQCGALGTHYRAGEVWEKAQRYLRDAGAQAAARSALPEAQTLFEQALDALEALPDGPSTLEQAFDVRLELRRVLNQRGDVRGALERLREAERLAVRLNDDRRRGRVYAFMTNVHSIFGEVDEALATGTRALEIAVRLGDARLRILTTTYLEQTHYYRGDYDRVVELAAGNLGALPTDWLHEFFGNAAPASVYDRVWLVLSLAQLGRFAEAAETEADMLRLAAPTQHAFTIGLAEFAAGTRHLLQGDLAKARSLLEHGTTVIQAGNVVLMLSYSVTSLAWVLAGLGETSEAASRLREAEELLERERARGAVGHRGWAYYSVARAALFLGRLDDARTLGQRVLEGFPGQLGFTAHALHLLGDIATHPDRFDAAAGEAYYRQALALAEARQMRPLVAHCHLGLAGLYAKAAKPAEAWAALTAAADLYRSMGMTSWLAGVEARLQPVR
jgi:DNA-binding SARP family transcriptional activator